MSARLPVVLPALLPLLLLTACPDDSDSDDDDGSDDGAGDMDPGDPDAEPDSDSDSDSESDSGADRDEDAKLLSWQEQRTITTGWGCTAEVMGEGVELIDADLSALCPDCDHFFEATTDIELACEDTGIGLQIISPYVRGVAALGDDRFDLYELRLAPWYDAESALWLAELDASGGGRMHYSYSGDWGEDFDEYGGYEVDGVLIID